MNTRKRILIIEDEAITALDLGQTLELLGYDVGGIVASGEDGIRAATESTYDLILSDIVLRGEVDGVQAALAIRRHSDVPVVFLTAYGDWPTLARAREAEPYGYLIKPFHAEALRATVETALLRSELERRLKSREAELQALATKLMVVRDEERAKLAQDLHDDLGQTLTLLRLGVAWVDAHPQEPADEMANRRREMMKSVDDAIASVRRLVSGLHPAVLDSARISDALDWQCREFAERTGLATHFEGRLPTECDVRLTKDTRTALFRMLQEALTNILRHAAATQVHVALGAVDDAVRLSIRDNGVGITRTTSSQGPRYGLTGLRERARSLGGTATIGTGPSGAGTEIEIRVPRTSGEEGAPA